MRKLGILAGLAILWMLSTSTVTAQELVYRQVSAEKLEGILKDLDITYRKVENPKDNGVVFYHFKRNNFDVRLHNYNGKDLWIDCVFTDKSTLDAVNRWNVRAKFSRAVFIKDGAMETISLESQIDCLGGTTDRIIRNFITRFDREMADFAKHVAK